MSDDPIRSALRAAEDAAREWTDGAPLPGMWQKQATAAAVAAFLRALPDAVIRFPRIGYTASDFAGKVERAAGGGDE